MYKLLTFHGKKETLRDNITLAAFDEWILDSHFK